MYLSFISAPPKWSYCNWLLATVCQFRHSVSLPRFLYFDKHIKIFSGQKKMQTGNLFHKYCIYIFFHLLAKANFTFYLISTLPLWKSLTDKLLAKYLFMPAKWPEFSQCQIVSYLIFVIRLFKPKVSNCAFHIWNHKSVRIFFFYGNLNRSLSNTPIGISASHHQVFPPSGNSLSYLHLEVTGNRT